jgi:prepilin-type N-terminal cleavage/methylation domain-containing protein
LRRSLAPARAAFTLIELLIVVAIIAILAAIAVPNFLEAQVRSKVSRAQSDLRTLATALESYRVDNNEYVPGHINPLNPSNVVSPSYHLIFPRLERIQVLTTPISYISTLPRDPFLLTVEPPENQVFSYWDPEHADAHRPGGAFNTPNLFQDVPSESTHYGGWVMASAGPDLIIETPAHQSPGFVEAVYDPTNGTTSRGLIWRFGP